MKKHFTLALASLLTFALGASAAAADFSLYGEFAYGLNQYIVGQGAPVVPDRIFVYGLGASVQTGAFLAGGDYTGVNFTGMYYGDPFESFDGLLSIRLFDAYGGLRLINAKAFKLYVLAGYAGADVDPSGSGVLDEDENVDIQINTTVRGPAAGCGAELVLGRFTLSGKALATIRAGGVLTISTYGEEMQGIQGPVNLVLADLRCTYNISDVFGVFAGLHYAGADGGPEADWRSCQAIWWTVGASLSF